MFKICSKCKIEKSCDEFYSNKSAKDGLSHWCIGCIKPLYKKYYVPRSIKYKNGNSRKDKKIKAIEEIINNPININPITKERATKENYGLFLNHWHLKNYKIIWKLPKPKKVYISKPIKLCINNCGRRTVKYDRCYFCREEEQTKVKREQRQIESKRIRRLKRNIRNHLKKVIKRHLKNENSKTHIGTMLGCTGKELILHIESTFQLGMTWNNYGFYGWHIDHIRPIIDFIRKGEDPRKANHYTNLQAMWGKDNIAKRDKIDF